MYRLRQNNYTQKYLQVQSIHRKHIIFNVENKVTGEQIPFDLQNNGMGQVQICV